MIHTHTFEPLIAGLALHRLFRIPVMHTVPALFAQMEEIGCGWLPQLYRERHKDIGLFFTGVSLPELQSTGVPPEKIRFIKGGVDVAAVTDAVTQREEHRAAVRREIGAGLEAPIALSVGRFHPSKGHRFAVRALPKLLQRHPDLHWIVLGIGAELNEVQRLAHEIGVAERAHFLGFRNDPLPYYAAADVYLRTPIYEAENLCSFQAMAAGLPVVGFDTGSATELLRIAGHGALAENLNWELLAEHAARILSLPDRGRALGQQGAEYARRHLDVRRTVAEYTDGYLTLASAPKGGVSGGKSISAEADGVRQTTRYHS